MSTAILERYARFGRATAIIDADGTTLDYQELVGRCQAFGRALGAERKLILLEAANDVASIVAYLGARAAGHCAILVGEDPGDGHRRIVDAFRPQLICRRGELETIADAPAIELHSDVSLLLPTSGSTGSSKLVRLSEANLQANAGSIAEYLEIDANERAITSLPFHYSYGMSVVNSHLHAGASIVLTDYSVTNPEFWRLVRSHRVTSIAGVPYSYELFERIGLRDNPPPSLRVMTQAGGRLSPELAKTYAAFARSRGGRFYAMYGQTEAAPRMAYLPPDKAEQNPDCVGVPVPGGSFRLIDDAGVEIAGAEAVGELVYSGPNVMMGYAFVREDLRRGREVEELRTGDLAMRTAEGLYKIVGRASRFVKIAGLRIGLDEVETLLSDAGHGGLVAGSDARIAICLPEGADPQAAREYIAQRCGLPASVVTAFAAAEAPRLASGKTDYRTILSKAEAIAAKEAAEAEKGGAIAAAYGKALGIPAPPADATFTSLGGDSLSYVNASIGVERALGHLPLGWETMTIASLEAMTPERPAPKSWLASISSEMVVRIAALGLVAAGHAAPEQTEFLRGGSGILFALAGYSLARFQRPNLLEGRVVGGVLASFYRVILPYFVLMAVLLPFSEADKSLAWPLLVSVFTVEFRGPLFAYWFIETVFHALLLTSALFLVPAVRRFAADKPFASAMALIAAAAAVKFAVPPVWNDGREIHLTVDAWLYAYFLGWAAYLARSAWQKGLVLLLATALWSVDFGVESSRTFWPVLGLFVVMFVPRLRLPAGLSNAVLVLAGASYFIYLMHPIAVHFIVLDGRFAAPAWFNIPAVLVASAAMGVAYASLWAALAPRALSFLRGKGTPGRSVDSTG